MNGLWFDGSGLQKNDFYSMGGVLAHTVPKGARVETVAVQPTAGIYTDDRTPLPDLKVRQTTQRDNLGRLRPAGVSVLIGSDH